jgi:hypothetical protein
VRREEGEGEERKEKVMKKHHKENVVHTYNEIKLGHNKDGNHVI